MVRKRNLPRLQPEAYIGQVQIACTICVQDRSKAFTDPQLVDRFVQLLGRALDENDSIASIYCFMPDHLHLLVSGASEGANPKAAVDKFKLLSGLWITGRKMPWRWQAGYRDHVIRISEDWRNQAAYVYMNPVRAGLVDDPARYPFTGAIGCDLIDTLYDVGRGARPGAQ